MKVMKYEYFAKQIEARIVANKVRANILKDDLVLIIMLPNNTDYFVTELII